MRSIIILATGILYSSLSFGQTDSTTASKKATFTVGSIYTNNASYYGQKAKEQTPYVALVASYRSKSGLYLNGLTYKLLNEKISNVSAASLSAGVTLNANKKLSTDLSFSHSFYPAYSPLLQAGNTENASVNFTYKSWLNIGLTGDYAFGKTNDEFVTGALSKMINLFSLGKKDIVTINPSADIVAGTQHFYTTYVTEQKARDSVLGIITDPLFGNPSQGGSSTTVAKTSFDILSYNFKFPLAYNRSHYVLEAAYQVSILSKKVQSGPGATNSFGTISFYYQF